MATAGAGVPAPADEVRLNDYTFSVSDTYSLWEQNVATPIKMPELGTTVDTVVLASWLKNEGETIERGEALCEVETDKAMTEMESIASGVLLRQLVSAGDEIAVGDVIAYVGKPGESLPDADDAASAEAGETLPSQPATQIAAGNEVPPLVRKLAERMGVDLDAVTGTGPGGRITREDVQRAKDAG